MLPEELGWFPEKITANLDGVILGMHAKKDNPELLAAQALGLPIYSYPEYLYEQSKDKNPGQSPEVTATSITAMVLHVLNYHDQEADFMVCATQRFPKPWCI